MNNKKPEPIDELLKRLNISLVNQSFEYMNEMQKYCNESTNARDKEFAPYSSLIISFVATSINCYCRRNKDVDPMKLFKGLSDEILDMLDEAGIVNVKKEERTFN